MMLNVRYVLRQLRRSPAFTVTALVTLMLGIGATTAVYSIVSGALLARLPYPEQEKLVGLGFTSPQQRPNNEQAGTTADFIARNTNGFRSLGVADDETSAANLSLGDGDAGHAVRITRLRVSRGYFQTLGTLPSLGRAFSEEEDLPHGPTAVLLSNSLWRQTFHADPKVLGEVIRVNKESFTVIGVMPPSFGSVDEGAPGQSQNVDVWTALHLNSLDPGYDGVNFKMIGRLRDNMSAAQAQQQMDTLRDAFYKQYPEYRRGAHPGRLRSFRVWPLQQIIVSEARTSLLTMLAAVIAVLLVACLNLGVLMTARASRRAPEIALRTALGATRRSILGLLMGESLLPALGGGAGGLVLARVMAPMLLRFSPIAIPQLGTRAGMQLVFVPVVTCAATMLFGLIPALGVFRQDVNQAIKPGAVGESPLQARLGKVLLVGQIAISMVLLSTALLLLGSFLRLRSVPSGIAVKQLTIAQVLLQGSEYDSTLHTTQFIDKVMAGLDHYHGVERVAAINGLPLDRGLNENGYPTAKPEVAQPIEIRAVTPGYFRTLGIAALSGRDITEADNATAVRVALVSNATARRWWPGEIPIGEQITMGGADEAPRTIIGTVSDVPQRSLAEAPQVVVYVPFAQLSDVDMKAMNTWFPTTFCVRMAGNVEIAEAIRRAVSDSDRDISVTAIEPMQNVIDRTIAGPAFFSYLAISFAGFAMLLTIVGLFGLLSYQVTQRTREIGIRLALGAPRIEVFSRVSGSALLLATIGLGLGGLISMAVPHVVGNILSHYVYTSGRPIAEVLLNTTAVLAMAAVTVLITTLCASYLPARRAAKIQPIGALRVE